MQILSAFLERFKNIRDPKQDKIDVAQILSAHLGEEISFDDVDIKNGIIFLRVSPMLKSQIFLSKEKILNSLNTENPKLNIKDIR